MKAAKPSRRAFEPREVRADFPALEQVVAGKPLVYLDSAATALKPRSVIDAVVRVYTHDAGNVHRAAHSLSVRATQTFEAARAKVARFLNAPAEKETIFVRGTTEAANLVAQAVMRPRLGHGDVVLVSELEHHSNLVPWQMLCEQTGATLDFIPFDERGVISTDTVREKMSAAVKVLACSHVSNALGSVQAISDFAEIAHRHGALVFVDGAQGAPHLPVDVQALGCDFYAFSGHKLYGPTGIGVLWGRAEILESSPPYHGGGDMIREVTLERTTYAGLPARYEAGTPHIAGAAGLGAAVDYLSELSMEAIASNEDSLREYAEERMSRVNGLRIIGEAPDKVGAISFVMEGAHPQDIGIIADEEGIALRTGHHCAQPIMQHFDLSATARASLGLYNTQDDIDRLVDMLEKVRELFR